MKYKILKYLIFYLPSIGFSQSYLGVSAGIDYAQIKEADIQFHSTGELSIDDKSFSTSSFFLGISGEQHLSKKISASVSFAYTRKKFDIDYGDFIHADKMSFNVYKSSLAMKWHFCKYGYLGSGIGLMYLSNVTIYYQTISPQQFSYVKNKKCNIPFLIGVTYSNITLEPYFILGIKIGKAEKNDIKPINSIGVSLSYHFRVSNMRR